MEQPPDISLNSYTTNPQSIVVTAADVQGPYLVLLKTTPGMEIGLVSSVLKNRYTKSASFNYLLRESGNFEIAKPFSNSNSPTWYELNQAKLVKTNLGDPRDLLSIAVDVNEDHCLGVLKAMSAGAGGSTPVRCLGLVIGRESPDALTLFDYSSALLKLVPYRKNIISVNMSVDFAGVCSSGKADTAYLRSPPFSIPGFSFPIFEDMIESLLSPLHDPEMDFKEQEEIFKGYVRPRLFASAGNHVGKGVRSWRLGYPALLPSVCAVSLHNSGQDGRATLADSASIPASFFMKPVLSLDAQELRVNDCRYDGTSFASAFMAGRYAKLAVTHTFLRCLGPLGATADIMSRYGVEPLAIHPSEGSAWMPVLVRSSNKAPDDEKTKDEDAECCGLAFALNRRFAPFIEFGIHGSMVALSCWCAINDIDEAELVPFARSFGDIDVLYLGSVLEYLRERKSVSGQSHRSTAVSFESEVRGVVRQWMEETYSRGWGTHARFGVDLHPLNQRPGGIEYLRGISPILGLAATDNGIIDPFGGIAELRDGNSTFYLPDEAAVLRGNPTIRSGGIVLGEGILNWISSVMLIRIVACGLGKAELAPRLDAGSVMKVHAALDRAKAFNTKTPAGLWWPVPEAFDPFERFDRRDDRVLNLLERARTSAANHPEATNLIDRIRSIAER